MITVVRHGKTRLNDTEDEKLRGWLNIPLSQQGKEEALDTGNKLRNLSLNIKDFHTSPLFRAVQTSHLIGGEIHKEATPTDSLKDWNVGNYTGKSVKETLPIIHSYLDDPSKSIPGGESYESFYNRTVPYLHKMIKDPANHLLVTHNRVTTLINAIAKNDPGLMKKKGPLNPGGIMVVHPDYSVDIVHKGQ